MGPNLGFAEFLVLAIVALIVVGPKDLPALMRRVGGVMRKARGMANEFRAAFDEMGREAELDDLKKEIQELKRASPVSDVKSELEALDTDARKAWRDEMGATLKEPEPETPSKPTSASSD